MLKGGSNTIEKCNLCGDNSGDAAVVAEEGGFKLFRCVKCGLMYVTPRPDVPVQIYDTDEYFKGQLKVVNQRFKLASLVFNIVKKYKNKGKSFEIGCGLGPFLQVAKKEGWDASGVDLSKRTCDYMKEQLNVEIINGDFLNIELREESYDLVVMWHALEHFNDPGAVLGKAYRMLRGQGLLLMAIPNADNFIYNFFYKMVRGKSPKVILIGASGSVEHLYHFTPLTISKMLAKNRFKILKMMPDWEMLSRCLYYKEAVILYFSIIFYFLTGKIGSNGLMLLAQKE